MRSDGSQIAGVKRALCQVKVEGRRSTSWQHSPPTLLISMRA
jgi:hypothetical protein